MLNIYNWSDYIADDTLKNFEKETGIKVNYDNYDTNEILHGKLVAGKTGYDIVVPSAHFAKMQIEAGLFQKLDKSKLTNWGNLDPALLQLMAKVDPGNQYLVDWLWGYITVGINTGKVKAALGGLPMPDNPWSLVFDPKYADKLKGCGISFLDSPSEVMPDRARLRRQAGLQPQRGRLRAWPARCSRRSARTSRASRRRATSTTWSPARCARCSATRATSTSPAPAPSRKRTATTSWPSCPRPAPTLFFDSMAIPADAPHPQNALLFINYILRPEVHASLTNKVFYANPNKASLKFVQKDVADNPSVFLKPDDLARMTVPDALPQDIKRVQTRTFTSFKTNQ